VLDALEWIDIKQSGNFCNSQMNSRIRSVMVSDAATEIRTVYLTCTPQALSE
jgi:hypothetical protein